MNTRILQNNHLRVEYLTNALRITGLAPAGKTNLLADVSDLPPVSTTFGDFHFRGGHRLWHSPEAMPRSYVPDTPVTVTQLPDGVLLQSQTEPGTAIRKQVEIHLSPDRPTVTLTHTLINEGLWTVDLAPWAITQFRLGGTAVLPMPTGNADPAGLLPNRQFSLWPYARITDPRLQLDDRFVLFKADALLPAFKFGYFNPNGWMAYWLDGIFFRKSFQVNAGMAYPDGNCNAELYCNDRFVELETLAPLTRLAPAAIAQHVETWDLLDKIDDLPADVLARL